MIKRLKKWWRKWRHCGQGNHWNFVWLPNGKKASIGFCRDCGKLFDDFRRTGDPFFDLQVRITREAQDESS
jgi:hypothetical protein